MGSLIPLFSPPSSLSFHPGLINRRVEPTSAAGLEVGVAGGGAVLVGAREG